jgi:glycerate 2-kinase
VRIVVACDKFKGSLTAGEATAAIATGIRQVRPDIEVVEIPVADGGDGTVEVTVSAGGRQQAVSVSGPLGTPTRAWFATLHDVAVVESAQACGLSGLTPSPSTALHAGTRGVGELMAAALGTGSRTLVVGLGGSASTDGGAGLAQALGIRLLDRNGNELPPGGGALVDLAHVDARGRDRRLDQVEVIAACDVTNPLLGARGAAHVFSPQKGAGPDEVARLEDGLRTLAEVLLQDCGIDVTGISGGGAAGGLAAGLVAFAGARIESGARFLLDVLEFEAQLADADLVITGEGSLDHQTLAGKVPAVIAGLADERAIPVVAIAGRVQLDAADAAAAGIRSTYALTDLAGPEEAMANAAALLARTGAMVAKDLPAA